MLFKIAFRNIWRNKFRTLITAGSIFFAVLFSSFMNSFQKGTWERMLDNVVNFYYGYAQIHQAGYWEDQNINKSFVLTKEFDELKNDIKSLDEITPRLESFALASYGNQTSGMLIIGTNPEKEHALTQLKDKLIGGQYFNALDKTVIIAEGVKQRLKIDVGDTLILISQGYHGVNAAGRYPVTGIVKFASPELNKKMIYMPLLESQYLFGATDRVTSIGIKLSNKKELGHLMKALKAKLPSEKYEIMDWKQMLPELVEAQKTDAAGNYVFLFVLYVLITFGIFGTILMMAKERSYEFGVLIAVGMKRSLLAIATWIEIIILGLMGAIAGILASIPLVYYYHINPIDFSQFGEDVTSAYAKWGFDPVLPTAFEFNIFFYQAIIVLILTSFLATYAMYKIYKIKPVEAMRS